MQTLQLNTTSVYRRLAQLTIAIGLLIVLFAKWIDADNQSKQLLTDNHSDLAYAQVNQSAQVAAHFIDDKQLKQLTRMLNDLTAQPFIIQAMVYDHKGSELARSSQAKTALEHYKQITEPFDGYTPKIPLIEQSSEQPLKQGKAIISEIRLEDKLLGFIRVNYLQQQALQAPLTAQQQIMEQVMLIGLLSGVMGFLLTRGFGRFSRNSFRIGDR